MYFKVYMVKLIKPNMKPTPHRFRRWVCPKSSLNVFIPFILPNKSETFFPIEYYLTLLFSEQLFWKSPKISIKIVELKFDECLTSRSTYAFLQPKE